MWSLCLVGVVSGWWVCVLPHNGTIPTQERDKRPVGDPGSARSLKSGGRAVQLSFSFLMYIPYTTSIKTYFIIV